MKDIKHFIILSITSILLLIFIQGCTKTITDEKWRFINTPDLHNSEEFVKVWESQWKDKHTSYASYRKSEIEKQIRDFQFVREKFDAELLVSPGDCNGGRWDGQWGEKFRTNFRSIPQYANLDNKQIIFKASRLCYTALNEIVYSSGFKEFLLAVGDHELGDNPWPKGSEKAVTLPYYRQGFAKYITLKSPSGESRFNKNIGKMPARPVGTIYENTSFAKQYKNVLFITLDVFRYDGPDKILGEEGLICGDITGEHLTWFENILKETPKIPSIKHIIVQAHLPIIYPVKKYASSGMLMSNTSDNILLTMLRKYNVDLYLAGEVHMNTVTKDPESDLIQFVARGNGLTNYTVVDVEEKKLTLTSYKNDESILGTLTIDKSSPQKTIQSSGELIPINPKGLQVHWDFEEIEKSGEFTCSIGSFPGLNRNSIFDDTPEGLVAMLNAGGFGKAYSLFGVNTVFVEGVIGKALKITDDSKLFTTVIGPMYTDFERTIAFWAKTDAKARRLILNSNSRWHPTGQFFNISLNEGFVEVSLRPDITATSQQMPVNDDKWHHIAVTVPHRKAKLSDCKIYVDGTNISDIKYQSGDVEINTCQANWMTIATQSKKFKTDLETTMSMSNFTGSIDDFKIWTTALSASEIMLLNKEKK